MRPYHRYVRFSKVDFNRDDDHFTHILHSRPRSINSSGKFIIFFRNSDGFVINSYLLSAKTNFLKDLINPFGSICVEFDYVPLDQEQISRIFAYDYPAMANDMSSLREELSSSKVKTLSE